MKRIAKLGFLVLLSATVMTSCKKDEPDDPIIPNEQEVITTLRLTLTPDGGGDPIIWSFIDLDGDGGNDPVVESPALSANTTYNGSLELLNELVDPTDNVTDEIEQEAEMHQFFFISDVAGLTMAYNDSDANGFPIGLASVFSSAEPASGTVTLILRHEPNKEAEGVEDGDITNAGGETDIEVVFDVEIN